MAKQRVTMRDVAKKAGVHFTTVSRALSNHPRIPESTRKLVQTAAIELGYAPDPMLSALTVYRSAKRKTSFRGTLGWVINTADRYRWWHQNEVTFVTEYRKGAEKKAQELGYNLEEFWLKDPELDWKRASEILYARNIRGLLIAPQENAKARVRLNWDHFAAVTLSHSLEWPKLHTIAPNTFLSMQTGVRQARSLGYRRIGLIMNPYNDMRINHGWTGGFLVTQQHWARHERIPVCFAQYTHGKVILSWMKKYKPDAIICHDFSVYCFLKVSGYRIPEDIGYFTPTVIGQPVDISGINEHSDLIGEAATAFLIGLINRGEWGIPQTPQQVGIRGEWHEGKTMPRRNII